MQQYNTTIGLSPAFIEKMKSDDYNGDLFEDVKAEISESDLNDLLQNYEHDGGTRGSVYGAQIKGGDLLNDGLGWFDVDYHVSYYFGCDDQDTTTDNTMEITAEVDLRNNTITLTGEAWEEREPDEY